MKTKDLTEITETTNHIKSIEEMFDVTVKDVKERKNIKLPEITEVNVRRHMQEGGYLTADFNVDVNYSHETSTCLLREWICRETKKLDKFRHDRLNELSYLQLKNAYHVLTTAWSSGLPIDYDEIDRLIFATDKVKFRFVTDKGIPRYLYNLDNVRRFETKQLMGVLKKGEIMNGLFSKIMRMKSKRINVDDNDRDDIKDMLNKAKKDGVNVYDMVKTLPKTDIADYRPFYIAFLTKYFEGASNNNLITLPLLVKLSMMRRLNKVDKNMLYSGIVQDVDYMLNASMDNRFDALSLQLLIFLLKINNSTHYIPRLEEKLENIDKKFLVKLDR